MGDFASDAYKEECEIIRYEEIVTDYCQKYNINILRQIASWIKTQQKFTKKQFVEKFDLNSDVADAILFKFKRLRLISEGFEYYTYNSEFIL